MQRRWIFNLVFLLILVVALVLLLRDSPTEQIIQLSDEQRTLASLEKVDNFPLYVMTYYGDYGFDDYLKQGVETVDFPRLSTDQTWACTVFSASNPNSDYLLGRNFDWHDHPALLLFTDPPQGFASVAMVDLHYLGFLKDQPPSDQALQDLLNAPYWTFDGMNEHGLAVGMMAVATADPGWDPEKVTIGSLEAIRLMLDYAKDVDEAIDLLQQYNIDFVGGPPLHYLIADGEGNSVVIEFIDGEMILLKAENPWQVSTNFLISIEKPQDSDSSCWRYNLAYEKLESVEGNISPEDSMGILEAVAAPSGSYPTIWSVVYNRSSVEIHVVVGRQYDNIHLFDLEITN
jgi:hypothetical protein